MNGNHIIIGIVLGLLLFNVLEGTICGVVSRYTSATSIGRVSSIRELCWHLVQR